MPKFCLMTFLLPILVAVALNFMGSIDLSSLGELHFSIIGRGNVRSEIGIFQAHIDMIERMIANPVKFD